MNILDYTFKDSSWICNLEASDRDDAIRSMISKTCDDSFSAEYPELSINNVINAIIDRENDRSTYMGHQIAFPHARLPGLKKAFFVVATFKKPVLFVDQEVKIICLMLIPLSDSSISLKLMSHISRLLSKPENRQKAIESNSSHDLQSVFVKQKDVEIHHSVMAKDIMRPPRWSVNEDTTLSECSKMMSDFQLSAIPVLNKEGKISGEITAHLLFKFGIPEFFSRLKSVSFIAEFDPFEKYFQENRKKTVAEIMNKNPKLISPEQTIMEIIFDLSVKNHPKLYIQDNSGEWLGTVDSGIVLHKVINLG